LEGRALDRALEALVHDWQARTSIKLAFEAGGSRPLPRRVEAGIYRIAQEALTNAVRHSHAQQALLRLNITPQSVRLAVTDDGTGFSMENVAPDRQGLIGMQERAHLLGGHLEICSNPGEGTQVEVIVPL
jgi:signal transduction histidine kinase